MNTYWRKNFSWSKSRQGLLGDCPLAYYYTYIGRYEQDNEAKIISSLVKLKKFIFYKGEIIHNAIRNQITQHCVGRPVSLVAAKNFLKMEFKKAFDNQGLFLSEAYNGFPLDEAFFKAQEEDALGQLENFFSIIWHNYQSLPILTHERLEHFFLEDIKVWVQPDLVTKNSAGNLMISDWKTGLSERAVPDDDLQLSVYILWASLHFGVAFEQIGAELVYLKSTQSFPTRRSAIQIDELKAHILNEARRMLDAKDRGEFVPRPRFNLCRGCNFATICPDSSLKSQIGIDIHEGRGTLRLRSGQARDEGRAGK